MRNAHPLFQCYPSVVPVGGETTVTIFPRDISRRFNPERTYQIAVLGLQDAEPEYYSVPVHDVPCYVKDGCLYVRLSSAPLRNELMLGRSILVKRLNEAVGREVIKDIIFR
mgnify:CR=1 FL=1